MPDAFSPTCLPDLGVGAGLVILGFRACAFGQQDCRCVNAMYEGALGAEGAATLGEVLVFTRRLASEGTRKIQLSTPGCGRMTRHEVALVSAVSALQAQDRTAADRHFARLLGRKPSEALSRSAPTSRTRSQAAATPSSLPRMLAASAAPTRLPSLPRRYGTWTGPAVRSGQP